MEATFVPLEVSGATIIKAEARVSYVNGLGEKITLTYVSYGVSREDALAKIFEKVQAAGVLS